MFIFQSETAKQNQKFPFHFFFRFAVGVGGGDAKKKARKCLGLPARVRERVRGALLSLRHAIGEYGEV